jgi:STE24 endopeptidase
LVAEIRPVPPKGPGQPDSPVVLDPERQAAAKRYARLRRRMWLLDLALGLAYLGLWLAAGWAADVRTATEALVGSWMVAGWVTRAAVVLAVALVLGLPEAALLLPLHFYSGFLLPHRFGLSTQTLSGWLSDQLKAGLIGAAVGAPLILGLYELLRADPETWWLWAAAGYFVFTAGVTAVTPVVLMPLFYRVRPLGSEHADLGRKLESLARRVGVRVQGVFSFDMSRRTKAANAALMGMGRTRRIVLGDNLLREFSPEETETVLAHELGHHANKDIPRLLLVHGLLNVASFAAVSGVLRIGAPGLDLRGTADPAGLPFFLLAFTVASLVTMPFVNGYTRRLERMADQFAVRQTGNPEAFARALTRLANQNLAEVDPEAWVVWLLHSHPPLSERIAAARRADVTPGTGAASAVESLQRDP